MAHTRLRRHVLGLGAAQLGAALLWGCRDGRSRQQRAADTARALGPSGSAARGGTLVFSDTEQVPSVQTQRLGSYRSYCLTFPTNVFLLYFDPYTKAFEPWVAERWGKNPENTEYWF